MLQIVKNCSRKFLNVPNVSECSKMLQMLQIEVQNNRTGQKMLQNIDNC